MAGLKFRGRIETLNGNPYLLISAARAKRIKSGWKKSLPVLVRVNGKPRPPWRINLMPIGDGRFYLYLHGDVRKASGTKVGDRVDVEVRFDSSYQNGPLHPMPDWFRRPLSQSPKAQTHWDALPPSRQKEVLRNFSGLQSREARERNLAKALHVLSGKPGRFMARDWTHGR